MLCRRVLFIVPKMTLDTPVKVYITIAASYHPVVESATNPIPEPNPDII